MDRRGLILRESLLSITSALLCFQAPRAAHMVAPSPHGLRGLQQQSGEAARSSRGSSTGRKDATRTRTRTRTRTLAGWDPYMTSVGGVEGQWADD